jgi:DNA-binding beta-propeller fold protein YncE
VKRKLAALLGTSAAVLVLLLPAPAMPQSKLELIGCGVGSASHAMLYDVNFSTGEATRPRSTGLQWLMDVAFAPDGTLYGLTTFATTPPNALVRIDPESGAFTTVGSTGMPTLIEGDLAFHPSTNELYGIQDMSAGNRLFRVDVSTGAATVIGDFGSSVRGHSDVSAMEFDGAGNLYAIDTAQQLVYAVDLATARILRSAPLSVPLGGSAGLAYHRDQETFYVADGYTGGTNTLYRLDVHSGRLTAIGPLRIPEGLSGLAFYSVR